MAKKECGILQHSFLADVIYFSIQHVGVGVREGGGGERVYVNFEKWKILKVEVLFSNI